MAVRQQAITWDNVDPGLCRHMASLGHNIYIRHKHIYHIYTYVNDINISIPIYGKLVFSISIFIEKSVENLGHYLVNLSARGTSI